MSHIILLSGTRSTGKTNLCAAVARRAREQGWDTAGLLSPGAFVNGHKTEIDVQDIRTQERHRLARIRPSWTAALPAEVHTDAWDFSTEAIEWGNQRLNQAVPCDLLVIDELGVLEFEHQSGWQSAFDVLANGAYRLAVVAVRAKHLDQARQRWPHAETWTSESFSEAVVEAFSSHVLDRLNGTPAAED